MKSIKPGRGPSGMNAIGSLAAVVVGIIWTIAAVNMDAPAFFPLFGILFVILGVVQLVYHYKNATGENRYSLFDITDESEERDPLNERFGKGRAADAAADAPKKADGFCPYCGKSVEGDYEFCPKCGRQLPK